MTIQDQKIEIAKFCGLDLTAYRFKHQGVGCEKPQWSPAYATREEAQIESDKENKRWSSQCWPVESFINPGDAPDYPADLNAMYEAKKVLSVEQRNTYWNHLYELVNGATPVAWLMQHGQLALVPILFATASQQSEAFLKTINKWKD